MENPRNLPVGQIFSESKRLVVPIYQRTYEWTVEKQIASLFDYVEAKAETRLSGEVKSLAHYMGALLLIPRGGYTFGTIPVFDIVDGQQRLTTFQIFLAALYDLARAHEFDGIAIQIRPMVFNTDESSMLDKKLERYKLEPTRYDRTDFRNLLDLDASTLKETYASHFHKIGSLKNSSAPKPLRAYWHLREEAESFIQSEGAEKAQIRLRALLQALLEDLRLIVITLDKDDDAQVIFETLNSGGEPLAAMDLVRNDVFHRAIKNKEDVDDLMDRRWSPFEAKFWKEVSVQGRIKKPRIDFFLANVLAAESGKEALMTELYAAYKQFASDMKYPSVDAELQVLLRHAPTYEGLVKPDGVGALGRLAEALAKFDVGTAFPLVFAIEASQPDPDVKAALYRMIEAYIVRRAVCNLTPKSYNKTFVRLAAHMKANGSTEATLGAAFRGLTGDTVEFPTDESLRAAVKSVAIYKKMKTNRLRFVLTQLEIASLDGHAETTGIKDDLQIEHVLPDSWYEHWALGSGLTTSEAHAASADEMVRERFKARQAAKHTLGNLTLLTQPSNLEVLNYGFSAKVERLTKSKLTMNLGIAGHAAWDVPEIEARSDALTELLIALWPYPAPIGGLTF